MDPPPPPPSKLAPVFALVWVAHWVYPPTLVGFCLFALNRLPHGCLIDASSGLQEEMRDVNVQVPFPCQEPRSRPNRTLKMLRCRVHLGRLGRSAAYSEMTRSSHLYNYTPVVCECVWGRLFVAPVVPCGPRNTYRKVLDYRAMYNKMSQASIKIHRNWYAVAGGYTTGVPLQVVASLPCARCALTSVPDGGKPQTKKHSSVHNTSR